MPSLGPVVIISVPVADQERAKAFYVDVLGCTVDTDQVTPQMRWVQVTLPGGGTSFSLVTWFDEMRPRGLRGVVIATDDIEAMRTELVARGLDIDPIDDQPYGRFATFEDIDGNGFVLMQPPSGAAPH
jgi:predicted enzyme related to lactoylglutathione lyase